ncbi:hypothetical protein GGI21_004198 [Coemansia aciculifera]|nr:hypothetical protein GGI21_004198 [Coemansia aciculifera]
MVCSLCSESYFKPGPKRSRNNKNGHLPVVLECGHAFHKRCVNIWYNNGNDSCPTCDQFQENCYTILYIDLDEEDGDAIKSSFGTSNNYRSNGNNDVQQLVRDMMDMSIGELADARREARAARERTEKLKADLDDMTEMHRIQLERADWLDNRVDELELLSERHRENLAGMQRSIQAKKELISEYEDRYGYLY